MYFGKQIYKKLDNIEILIGQLSKNNEFDKRMIELGNLRRKINNTKSLISLTKILDTDLNLKNRKYYSRNLDNIPEPQKLATIKSRVLQTIDSMISTEVMKHYNIKRKN